MIGLPLFLFCCVLAAGALVWVIKEARTSVPWGLQRQKRRSTPAPEEPVAIPCEPILLVICPSCCRPAMHINLVEFQSNHVIAMCNRCMTHPAIVAGILGGNEGCPTVMRIGKDE